MRNQEKVGYKTGSKETYLEFCKAHPKINITHRQYKIIITAYNKMFRDYILETGEKFRMPHGFGDISIRKWKKATYNIHPITGEKHIALAIDWARTKAIGKRVYHLNSNTDGFRFQWKWFKDTAKIEFPFIYNFKPARETSRKIAEYIKKIPDHYHTYREWNK